MCIQIPPIEKDIHLWHGKSEELLQHVEDNSIDSIVTDPPYGISFMGKDWDSALPPKEVWQECIRVLKPGGYIVAMSASRMYHRLAVQLEDLGLICHPMIGWIYGSGFPKATDLSKQFDKQNGTVRTELDPVLAKRIGRCEGGSSSNIHQLNATPKEKIGHRLVPQSRLAKKWDGYKYGLQALKPALEPIAVFQKPWKSKDVKRMTDNVKKHGIGAFNIDACRVSIIKNDPGNRGNRGLGRSSAGFPQCGYVGGVAEKQMKETKNHNGRHPANLLHDGSESVEKAFLNQGGVRKTGDLTGQINAANDGNGIDYGKYNQREMWHKGDTGSASRYFNKLPITEHDIPFFYCSKPSKKEKNSGLNNEETCTDDGRNKKIDNPHLQGETKRKNSHPTVKPIALMEWLIKLVTPVGGVTVDPFLGSGTTGIAAVKNNFKFIGIEKELDSYNIAQKRIEHETMKAITEFKKACTTDDIGEK